MSALGPYWSLYSNLKTVTAPFGDPMLCVLFAALTAYVAPIFGRGAVNVIVLLYVREVIKTIRGNRRKADYEFAEYPRHVTVDQSCG